MTEPHSRPEPPSWPGTPAPPRAEPPTRPVDVDTGFWLWVAALPLMVIGYVADLVGSHTGRGFPLVYVAWGLFVAVLCTVVVTFLVLMRAGYRWARTVLTGGGLATVVYVAIRVFTLDWPPVIAVICAVTGIFGCVLVVGGMFLLHRGDAHGYFTR